MLVTPSGCIARYMQLQACSDGCALIGVGVVQVSRDRGDPRQVGHARSSGLHHPRAARKEWRQVRRGRLVRPLAHILAWAMAPDSQKPL